jgi:energy-coupling factor transporter transmembrane protein EcfT
MKVVRILRSAFKPGGFYKAIMLWLVLCVVTGLVGKLTGDVVLMWVGPISVTLAIAFIFYLIYRALDGHEKVEDGPNYFN